MENNIHLLTCIQKANEISQFFFSSHSFDDYRFTPGEEEHFRKMPLQSLTSPDLTFWYMENDQGEIIAALSFMQNEQKTRGYFIDYIAIHRAYRRSGLGRLLLNAMINFLKENQARYLLTYTCDLPDYVPFQKLLKSMNFQQVGHCPDYYYKGEGRLIYYLNLEGN